MCSRHCSNPISSDRYTLRHDPVQAELAVIIFSILQVRKRRHKDVKYLVPGHTAKKCQSQIQTLADSVPQCLLSTALLLQLQVTRPGAAWGQNSFHHSIDVPSTYPQASKMGLQQSLLKNTPVPPSLSPSTFLPVQNTRTHPARHPPTNSGSLLLSTSCLSYPGKFVFSLWPQWGSQTRLSQWTNLY